MQLSVVIVSYNVRYFLELCLQSVLKAATRIDCEIIVVDNNSTDDTCKVISEKYTEVNLIKSPKNLGFAKANNLGVSKAKGDYVLILNPDTVVAEDTFINCLAFAKEQKDLGALGVKLIDGNGNFLPESKRNFPTPLVTFYKMLGLNSKKHAYYAKQVSENAIGKVEVLVGAFMLIKKSTYFAVNGFDEDYFMYGEDIDLSYKLSKKGYQNYYLGTETVIHFKGESTQKNVKYLKYFYGAMQLFYKKHLKKDFLFSLILKVGICFWYGIKYFQLNFKKSSKPIIQRATYLGADMEILYTLKNQFKEVEFKRAERISEIENTLIDLLVLDVAFFGFKSLINTILELKNKNIKFRILSQNCDFALGSDNAIERGEVITLN
jgi:GT2 family glycosyltransferase